MYIKATTKKKTKWQGDGEEGTEEEKEKNLRKNLKC